MLTVWDARRSMSRRQMVTIGSLGVGALSLPSLLAARAAAKDASVLDISQLRLRAGVPTQIMRLSEEPPIRQAF